MPMNPSAISVTLLMLLSFGASDDIIQSCTQCKNDFKASITLPSIGVTKYIAAPANMKTCELATCIWTVTAQTGWVRADLHFLHGSYSLQEADSISVFEGTNLQVPAKQRCTSFETQCTWVTVQSHSMTIVFDHHGASYAAMNVTVTAVAPFACGPTDVTTKTTGEVSVSTWDYPYTFCPQDLNCTYNIKPSTPDKFVWAHPYNMDAHLGTQLVEYDTDGTTIIQMCDQSSQQSCADRTSTGGSMKLIIRCAKHDTFTTKGVSIAFEEKVTAPTGTQHCGKPVFDIQTVTAGNETAIPSPGNPDGYCGHNENLWRLHTVVNHFLYLSNSVGSLPVQFYNDLPANANSETSSKCNPPSGLPDAYYSRGKTMALQASNSDRNPSTAFQMTIKSMPICPPLTTVSYTAGGNQCQTWKTPTYHNCDGYSGEFSDASCAFLYHDAAVKPINITTQTCDMAVGSNVIVYDGKDASGTKLLEFTYNSCPRTQVSATSGNVFIQYKSGSISRASLNRQGATASICFTPAT